MLTQAERIGKLEEERRLLQEKISKNYLADLLRAMNILKEGIQEKKNKIAKIDNGLEQIQDALAKIEFE